jgi:hypothetical protein
MDEDNIWLSEEEDEAETSADPGFFTMGLTYQGIAGGNLFFPFFPLSLSLFLFFFLDCPLTRMLEFRTRNKPGQQQRSAVSAFQGGSKRKPAFSISCNAKAMIHGRMSPSSQKQATLLVYEFRFYSYRGRRIKEADILFAFHPKEGHPGRVTIAQIRPHGVYMMKTEETAGSKLGLSVNGSFMGVGLAVTGRAVSGKDCQLAHRGHR